MAMQFNRVTVGTSATFVIQQVPAQGANIIFTNGDSATIIYMGGSGVTTTTGAPIPPYGVIAFREVVGETPVYAIAGGTVSLPLGIFYGDLR